MMTYTKPALSKRRVSVEIQRFTSTPDDQGGSVETWATLVTVRGRVMAVSGDERFVAGRTAPVVTHKAFLPARTDVTEADRLKVGDNIYTVSWVLNPGDVNDHLEVFCLQEKP